jgi:baculoviral IAP repeat-containing protein 6
MLVPVVCVAKGARFTNFDKRYMCSESTRRATFSHWPHMDYKWVLPDALAQAGFFHQPSAHGDDRTVCFACDLCLVAWEPQDQPWSEHERHSAQCLFVRGECTDNVPLALTAANQCASQVFRAAAEQVACTSELSSDRYFAVSNAAAHIVVYDSKDLLKVGAE